MKKMKYTLLFFMLISIKNITAQIPVNDSAWILQTALSDEFSGSTLDYSKWYTRDSVPDHGLEMMFDRSNHKNVSVSGGYLRIKVDTLNPNRYYYNSLLGVTDTFRYQSGTINSNYPSFKYGYLEISARFPTGNTAYWPALWLWNQDCTLGNRWYQEIDIAENGSLGSLAGNQMDMNFHWASAPLSCYYGDSTNIFTKTGLPRIDSVHKYAAQWDADSVTFYFDDIPVRTLHNPLTPVPNHLLTLVMDIYVDGYYVPHPHMPATNFVVDYFHYYKLNTDCSASKTISKPGPDYYWASPARAVKKSIITTTVGASSPTFNLSDDCTLRATDYIILDAGTTINGSGSGQFSAIVAPCPN